MQKVRISFEFGYRFSDKFDKPSPTIRRIILPMRRLMPIAAFVLFLALPLWAQHGGGHAGGGHGGGFSGHAGFSGGHAGGGHVSGGMHSGMFCAVLRAASRPEVLHAASIVVLPSRSAVPLAARFCIMASAAIASVEGLETASAPSDSATTASVLLAVASDIPGRTALITIPSGGEIPALPTMKTTSVIAPWPTI